MPPHNDGLLDIAEPYNIYYPEFIPLFLHHEHAMRNDFLIASPNRADCGSKAIAIPWRSML
jgi:hypothetical protein